MARHSVQLLRSLQSLRTAAETLRQTQDALGPAPGEDATIRRSTLTVAESAFKSAYSNALMVGARDDDLADVEELMLPLRSDAQAMSSEELLTRRDIDARHTQEHDEAVRRAGEGRGRCEAKAHATGSNGSARCKLSIGVAHKFQPCSKVPSKRFALKVAAAP
jgi:hypothetical protein